MKKAFFILAIIATVQIGLQAQIPQLDSGLVAYYPFKRKCP